MAQGTYKPTTNPAAPDISLAMKEGVAIYNGFTSGQMNLSDHNPNPETNGTVLSGDIDGDGTLAGNSYHLFVNGGGLSQAAILDGFTLTGSNTPENFAKGGAIWNRGGSAGNPCNPYIAHCLFRDNYAVTNGAAVFNEGGGAVNATPNS